MNYVDTINTTAHGTRRQLMVKARLEGRVLYDMRDEDGLRQNLCRSAAAFDAEYGEAGERPVKKLRVAA